jgi:hypothetical protein
MALVGAPSIIGFFRLAKDAGAALTGRRAVPA